MNLLKLFHISEEPDIRIFNPRPSPSEIKGVEGDVVFAISERLLHNYLLPRDCPRVTFYAKPYSLRSDIEKFFGQTKEEFVIAVEKDWYKRIKDTTLYSYEFSSENFTIVDEGAGYYVSHKSEIPVKITTIQNPVTEILKRNVELRYISNLRLLGDQITKSTLQYSLIRMRNALKQ